jgi:small subunit ribosomal protein S3
LDFVIIMGRKVSPIAFRLGGLQKWRSHWFSQQRLRDYLEQDWKIRNYIRARAKDAAIEKIEITRSGSKVEVAIHAARPGLLIGRKGAKIKELEQGINKVYRQLFSGTKAKIRLEIKEIRDFDSHANLIAQDIAEQLEKRLPFRRALKQAVAKIMRFPQVKGVRIEVAGRLGGAEMSRRERLSEGEVPLGSLRADIDYGFAEARTTYGTIGVKVWINKGEVFGQIESVSRHTPQKLKQ